MGVGDANGTEPMPSATQTALINERRRAPLNQLKVDPTNSAIIIAEQVIPEDVGGWWIREIGLYDADGDLVAIANCAPSFKPLLTQGSGRTQVVRMNMIVSNASNVELKIDPSVVLATRAYVDAKVLEELNKLDSKQSVRVATTANIALAGLQTIDAVALVAGDRVLVKNQAVAKDNGLYIAAAGVWARTTDADTNAEVTSALVVSVEQGATLADTRWQLVTDGVIVLGATALTFQDVTQGYAPINSPDFLGTPKVPTPAQFDASKLAVNAEFVQRALGNKQAVKSVSTTPVALTTADVGKLIDCYAAASVVNLPLGSTVTPGATFLLYTATKLTLQAVGGNLISPYPSAVAVASMSIPLGTVCEVVWNGAAWLANVQGAGISSRAPSGYQKLTSGLIIQWGAGSSGASGNLQQTLPIAFSLAQFVAVASSQGESNPSLVSSVFSLTLTGIDVRVRTLAGAVANVPVSWVAFGH
jgi:hypothetical protein